MAIPVVIATNGLGIPVKQVASGATEMEVANNGFGVPIVLADSGAPYVVTGAVQSIGGVTVGAAGTGIYSGYNLADGDDFLTTTAADFLTPTNAGGKYMVTRNYGVQSGVPRYLRGSASLGGYEADPWHTGYKDANRGVVPSSYSNMITFGSSILKIKSRRATAEEKTLMGDLNGKNNLSSMVHMGRRNMQRAPCMMEMRLRFPYSLSAWDQWHPTFWLIQAQPGNGWDGLELDCEGFTPALQFNRNTWLNGVGSYGPTLGNTAAVSKTVFRTYAFEVLQVATVWTVRLWEDGVLVASGSPDFGGNIFDPTRPFLLMMTNHILQSGITQGIFDTAGDVGADIECDWWRGWRPSTGVFRKPLVGPAMYQTPFNTAFSFALPTPQAVWGADVSADVIEMIPNEDNSPAQPWVRTLLPPSVTRTGNTIAGTIADQPGRLILARSATPAAGDGCVPQPITIAVGPRVNLNDANIVTGATVNMDIFALCDCGDLHIGKTVSVSGLAGSGLSYSSATGLLTGTAAEGVYSVTVATTNSLGQSANATKTFTVAAAPSAYAYESWGGPGWFDASDAATLTLSGSNITALANKRSGGGDLTAGGTASGIQTVAAAQNGRAVIRVVRDVSSVTSVPRLTASTAATLSTMFQGNDKPYTVIAAYKPTDTNTGYIWSASDTVGVGESQQIALIRRNATAPSIRRQLVTATPNDVTWGAGQASGTPRIVASKHTGTALDVWDNSATTKVVTATAQDVATFNAELAFHLLAAETGSASDPSFAQVQCNMDFYECVIVDSAMSDADIQQAISDLGTKWAITLT